MYIRFSTLIFGFWDQYHFIYKKCCLCLITHIFYLHANSHKQLWLLFTKLCVSKNCFHNIHAKSCDSKWIMHNFIVPEEGGFNKQQQKRGQSNSFFYPTDQYTKTAPNSKYLYPPQWSCRRVYLFHHVRPSICRQILCRTITWVVFLRIF